MTEAQKRALIALKDTSPESGISAAEFARRMWPNNSMHTSSKNTGNGSCRGKAAWLCGGSYLAKLKKIMLTNEIYEYGRGYTGQHYITQKGRDLLINH